MNNFCLYCTGNNKSEIWGCEFRNCPFHIFRRCNLEWQIRRIELEKAKKVQKAKRAYKSKYKKSFKQTIKNRARESERCYKQAKENTNRFKQNLSGEYYEKI